MLALGPASGSPPASSPFPCSRGFGSGGCAASASSSSCLGLEGLGGGKARRQDRKEEEERAAPSRSPDGGWRMRGAPRSPPPQGHFPVQGATACPWVLEAGVIGQAMSLRGDGNEPMWKRRGLERTTISHQLFPVPGASRVSPSFPPREG